MEKRKNQKLAAQKEKPFHIKTLRIYDAHNNLRDTILTE